MQPRLEVPWHCGGGADEQGRRNARAAAQLEQPRARLVAAAEDVLGGHEGRRRRGCGALFVPELHNADA